MIIWIASYPKSGNTWVRSFISSLLYSNDGTNDFSYLKNIKQFPDRSQFKNFIDDFQNIKKVYQKCKNQEHFKKEEMKNYVKEIYKTFSAEEISTKIAELLKPKNSTAEVIIIYQSIGDLHLSCPNHTGDWYFTGDYPTPGGIKVLNNAFINYIEGKNQRAY